MTAKTFAESLDDKMTIVFGGSEISVRCVPRKVDKYRSRKNIMKKSGIGGRYGGRKG